MPPAVVPGAPKKVIDPSKPGKFSVKIGDSLKDPESGKKQLTSLKYNHKPSTALNNGRKSTLRPSPGGLGNEVTVEITPNDAAEPPAMFTGAQGPSKKTECVLIYDPATGTFTLEKLLSTFTLNCTSAGASAHPPLAPPKFNPDQSDEDGPSSSSSEEDPTKADKENPFDYRHFINNKFEVPTSSSRLQTDKVRKQRLEKFQEELSDPNASSSEEDRMEEDHSSELVIDENPVIAPPARQSLPARPRSTPAAPKAKPKAIPKTPAASKKSAANAGPFSLGAASRKGAVPTESIDLGPSPVPTPSSRAQTGNKRPRDADSSEESDADNESEQSDEDEDGADPEESGGLLIVEEDGSDNRNNRSRSTTAGTGTIWTGPNLGGPISLSTKAQDSAPAPAQDPDSDEDDEDEEDDDDEDEQMAGVAPTSHIRSMNGYSAASRPDETEESSEEYTDDEHSHSQLVQSAPTPNGNAAPTEEEDEDDLANMLEIALEEETQVYEESEESESEEE